ncbi:TPA: hypothetical protein L3310_003602 [Vibrio cholerae]|nr:hypothetical protein [Vibrio cholerae]HBN6886618.1 hypothetical protein [Vibrio cholerae]HBN6896973.1 hypothetical protein [Vibrio cholerae]
MKASIKIAVITFREDESIIKASEVALPESKERGEQQIREMMESMAKDGETDIFQVVASKGQTLKSFTYMDDKTIEHFALLITRMVYFN